MSRGIIYVMTTVVPGLVKIGKTGSANFEQRMYGLERNGYFNVTGLKRRFAIEVEDYDEKEAMLDEIFSRSRVPNSELFALDVDLVVQLLASFDGTQVFPKAETKEQAFDQATADHEEHIAASAVPNGRYHMRRRLKRDGNRVFEADMIVEDGSFVIPAGERISLVEGAGLSPSVKLARENSADATGTVTSTVAFDSPSAAGSFVIGASCDGWKTWRTADGDLIDVFRRK